MSIESPVSPDPPAPAGPPTGARGRRRKLGRNRRPVIAAVTVLGVLLVIWLGAATLLGDAVPRGVTVLGTPIGGLAPEAAERRLQTDLADRVVALVPVTVGPDTLSFDPAAAGLGLDAQATVESTGTGSWNPLILLRRFGAGGPTDPVASVDEEALTGALAALAEQVDRQPVQGDVTFSGASVVPVAAVPGRKLDRDAAAEELIAGYLQTGDPITLTARVIAPTVTETEVQRAVAEFATPAVAAPVALVSGGQPVEVTAAELGAVLSMDPVRGRLEPVLDGTALVESIRARVAAFEQPPIDARIAIADGAPKIEPSVAGRVVDGALLAEAVLPVLPLTGSSDRVAIAALKDVEPALTTAEAEALGVKEVVSEFTTKYPNAAYRRVNIGRAAEKINGTLLEPGEEFSMNAVVGERTVENGFTTGTVISGGVFVDGLGGGVSQVATTTFNAAFYAGLEDIEHKPHSVYISRYPVGREATVAWNQTDLRFRNDTPYGVLIETVHEVGKAVTVRMWSTRNVEVTETRSGRSNIRPARTVYDTSPDCEDQPPTNGFDITVKRTVKRAGAVVHDDTFFTEYNAANRIICRPDPATMPPPASASPGPGPSSGPGPGPSPSPSPGPGPGAPPAPAPSTPASPSAAPPASTPPLSPDPGAPSLPAPPG